MTTPEPLTVPPTKLELEREAHKKKLTRKPKKRKDNRITEKQAQEKRRVENEARARCKEFGLKTTKKQTTLQFK